jgi:hypothetical protein
MATDLVESIRALLAGTEADVNELMRILFGR